MIRFLALRRFNLIDAVMILVAVDVSKAGWAAILVVGLAVSFACEAYVDKNKR